MSEVKTDKISSVSTNGDITLDPDGTGKVAVTGSATMTGTDTFNSNATGSGILLKDSGVTSRQLHIAAPGSVSEAVIGTPNSHNLTFATNNTERMRIDTSGNVGITSFSFSTAAGIFMNSAGRLLATCGGDSPLALSRKTDNGHIASFYRDTALIGNISITGSAVSFNTTSDHRTKENVADMTGAIARVKQLAPKRFNFISDTTDTLVDGFLAHEAQTVVPEAITGTHNEVDDDGNAVMQGIDQSKLVPLLTGALQEAIAKIETLETKVAALEGN